MTDSKGKKRNYEVSLFVLKVVGEWRFSLIHCDILLTLDVMMCTASILNLCAISIDRSGPTFDFSLYSACTIPSVFQQEHGRGVSFALLCRWSLRKHTDALLVAGLGPSAAAP